MFFVVIFVKEGIPIAVKSGASVEVSVFSSYLLYLGTFLGSFPDLTDIQHFAAYALIRSSLIVPVMVSFGINS